MRLAKRFIIAVQTLKSSYFIEFSYLIKIIKLHQKTHQKLQKYFPFFVNASTGSFMDFEISQQRKKYVRKIIFLIFKLALHLIMKILDFLKNDKT